MSKENDDTRVIYGNGLQSRYLLRAEIDTRRGALALTANDEVNYLFIQKVKEESKGVSLWAALKSDSASLTTKMLHKSGAELIFGTPVDVDVWNRRFNLHQVYLEAWQRVSDPARDAENGHLMTGYSGNGLIAAAVRRKEGLSPVGDITRFKNGDVVVFFLFEPELGAAAKFLEQADWQRLERIETDTVTTSTCPV